MIAIDRNYAPMYSELGMYYEIERATMRRRRKPMDSYLLLAPNFADSADVRKRAQQNRAALLFRSHRPRCVAIRTRSARRSPGLRPDCDTSASTAHLPSRLR